MCRTPIFTPSTGRASTGLFNLAHIMKHQKYMHVIVVNENEVPGYRKQWPTHVIMAVPNMPELYSLGKVQHARLLLEFMVFGICISRACHANKQHIHNIIICSL